MKASNKYIIIIIIVVIIIASHVTRNEAFEKISLSPRAIWYYSYLMFPMEGNGAMQVAHFHSRKNPMRTRYNHLVVIQSFLARCKLNPTLYKFDLQVFMVYKKMVWTQE